ncbi:MAG: hypothetical protein JRJ85_14310 [Deltaproteobacteria bacterium]|nr:hypothetical protein [Deltaproteobacteria bacterium]
MISEYTIVITSMVAVALCFFTAWTWRGRFVAVNWLFFAAMGIGAGVRGWFYYNINLAIVHGRDTEVLIPLSRYLAEFVLVTTALMAVGALVYYYVNIRLDE